MLSLPIAYAAVAGLVAIVVVVDRTLQGFARFLVTPRVYGCCTSSWQYSA
jgi:hypothetical protein